MFRHGSDKKKSQGGRVRYAILAICMALATSAAFAGWRTIQQDDGEYRTTVQIDTSTVHVEKGLTVAWFQWSMKKPVQMEQGIQGAAPNETYKSVRTQLFFDCSNSKYASGYSVFYRESDGKGKVVGEGIPKGDHDRLMPIVPDSVAFNWLIVACTE